MNVRFLVLTAAVSLLLMSSVASPAFAQQGPQSFCPTLLSHLPSVFAGYCATPRGANQSISGGFFTFTVPSLSGGSPGAELTVALAAFSSIGLVSTGVHMYSNGDDSMFAGSPASISVNPGDTLAFSISIVPGGYLLEVQDLASGVSASNTIPTNLPILAILFVMSEIQDTCIGNCTPTTLPTFGSVSITRAQLFIGHGHSALASTAHFPLNMSSLYSGDALVNPTGVIGQTFTLVQVNTS